MVPCFRNRKGFSLIEILVATIILSIVMGSTLLLFRNILLRSRMIMAEKRMMQETSSLFLFLRRHLNEAVVRDIESPYRIDFIGDAKKIRFIAPWFEGKGSDLGTFAILFDPVSKTVRVSYMRLSADRSDYTFPETFPGSHPISIDATDLLFHYSDGKLWYDSWDTRRPPHKGKLPQTISVELTISGGKREGKEIYKKSREEILLQQTR
ncbi:MAG: prepilin-type N-terminal cleavage/methylation domain-containing protein [Candidatus Ratteibacteria bacterium]|jgi:prepilin-type N-terminal cleavage/methylation domain-containing protein